MDDSSSTLCLKIMVVDDNEANRAFAVAAMEDEGFAVHAVDCAREALRSLETFEPDCVLLDVRMPEMDGFAACRELRGRPRGEAIAVVFVTAARDAETFDLAMAVGADDFIAKPVLANELVGRVRSAVRARALSAGVVRLHATIHQLQSELARLGDFSPEAPRALQQLSEQTNQMLKLAWPLLRSG